MNKIVRHFIRHRPCGNLTHINSVRKMLICVKKRAISHNGKENHTLSDEKNTSEIANDHVNME